MAYGPPVQHGRLFRLRRVRTSVLDFMFMGDQGEQIQQVLSNIPPRTQVKKNEKSIDSDPNIDGNIDGDLR